MLESRRRLGHGTAGRGGSRDGESVEVERLDSGDSRIIRREVTAFRCATIGGKPPGPK